MSAEWEAGLGASQRDGERVHLVLQMSTWHGGSAIDALFRDAEQEVRAAIVEQLRGLEPVQRLLRLEGQREQWDAAAQEQVRLRATLRRVEAEREEALATVPDNLSDRLTQLDDEAASVRARLGRAEAVVAAMAAAAGEARQGAAAVFEQARRRACVAAVARAVERQNGILRSIGMALGSVLTELAATRQVGFLAAQDMLGANLGDALAALGIGAPPTEDCAVVRLLAADPPPYTPAPDWRSMPALAPPAAASAAEPSEGAA